MLVSTNGRRRINAMAVAVAIDDKRLCYSDEKDLVVEEREKRKKVVFERTFAVADVAL